MRLTFLFQSWTVIFWQFCFLSLCLTTSATADGWNRLENSRFISNSINDGDSFMIKHEATTYVFRLYWIDTPETGKEYSDRLRDQAGYFNLSDREVMQIGREAKLFTREFLKGKITVFTQWENGQGNGQRYYAIVNSSEGNLVEALVENGLARIYGYTKSWPEEPNLDAFRRKLWKLEKEAKEKKRGAWRDDIQVLDPFEYEKILAALPDLREKVNINTATQEELILLPGIGATYSKRIIEARPFHSINELTKIKGIGPKTLDRIRGLISLEDAE